VYGRADCVTAKYWGDKAVVCRSSEDCAGRWWTSNSENSRLDTGKYVATRLNEVLKFSTPKQSKS